MAKRISLSQSKFAIIDDADFELVSQYKWRLHKGIPANPNARIMYYARGRKVGASRTEAYMHRLILGVKKGQEVDHKNRNGLDNRRANLRIATSSQTNATVVQTLTTNTQNTKVSLGASKFADGRRVSASKAKFSTWELLLQPAMPQPPTTKQRKSISENLHSSIKFRKGEM